VKRLSKRQAVVVSAYTGVLLGSFEDLHKYAQVKLARPVWTHEFASTGFAEELRDASREDFLRLNPIGSVGKGGQW